MSEYISLETEQTDKPNVVIIHTNLNLAPDGPEVYPNLESGEEGSPLAQTLFIIDGILALTIQDGDLIITHEPELELFVLVDEVDAALKDFFL
jgi:hypothetical protein